MKYILNRLERTLQLLDVSNWYTCLATNEDWTLYVTEDNDLENILSRSIYTNMKNKEWYVLDMKLWECHKNVTLMIENNGLEELDKVFTGYALNFNWEWFPHSWIKSWDNKIIETFNVLFNAYYWYELNNKEIVQFCKNWK